MDETKRGKKLREHHYTRFCFNTGKMKIDMKKLDEALAKLPKYPLFKKKK